LLREGGFKNRASTKELHKHWGKSKTKTSPVRTTKLNKNSKKREGKRITASRREKPKKERKTKPFPGSSQQKSNAKTKPRRYKLRLTPKDVVDG